MKCRTKTVDLRLALSGIFKCSAAQSIQPSSQSNLPPNYFGLFPSQQAIVLNAKKNRIRVAIDCKSSGFSI